MSAPAQFAEDRAAPAETALIVLGAGGALALAILTTQELALIGLAGVLLFAVFLRSPITGFYLTTILLLVSGSATVIGDLRLQIPLTASKVVGAAAFAAWLTDAVVRGRTIRFPLAMGVLTAFLVWTALGTALSPRFSLQWPEWVRLLTLLSFFLLAINVLVTRARIRTFVIVILLCGLVMSVSALLQYFVAGLHLEVDTALADIGARTEGAFIEYDTGGPVVRVSGLTGHSNWLAMVILVIMPLNAYWFVTTKRWSIKVLALVAVAMEIAALILTFTRTGFLVGAVVLTLLVLRNLLRMTPQRILALAVAAYMGWFVLPEGYKARVLDVSSYARSESVSNRLQLQEVAFGLWAQHPVFGVGLGGYGPHLLEANRQVSRTMRWFVDTYDWPPQFIGTHNMYLQLLCETGLVGTALFLAFFAVVLRGLRRTHRELQATSDAEGTALVSSLEVSLIAFLVCGVFLHALQQKVWWMLAALAAVSPLYYYSRAAQSVTGSLDPKDGPADRTGTLWL